MEETAFMSRGEKGVTHLTVRTDGPDDALMVPSGVETVLVDDTAQRVIIPEGVQVVRLQRGAPAPAQPAERQHSFGDMVDELIRAKRSVATDSTQTPGGIVVPRREAPPAMSEKSLSLPSCPPTPPGSRSMGTSMSVERNEPLANVVQHRPTAVSPQPFTAAVAQPSNAAVSQPPAAATQALATATQPPAGVTQPPAAVTQPPAAVTQSPTAVTQPPAAVTQPPTSATRQPLVANGSASVRFTGSTEKELRDPLVRSRSAKLKQHDSFGWREEFERGEVDHKRTFSQRLGRVCADVLCCWVGV